MKQWSIFFKGEFGQYVIEIWNEQQIINSFYKYWSTKMLMNGDDDISRQRCINDWCLIHSAVEQKPFEKRQ